MAGLTASDAAALRCLFFSAILLMGIAFPHRSFEWLAGDGGRFAPGQQPAHGHRDQRHTG
jgi:hypothetical protein